MSGGRSRDGRWLAGIFDDHAADVHRYARRRLHGAADPNADADDVTAEVFAITWRRRHDVDEPVLAWLYGVARRVVASHRRRVTALPTDMGVDDGDVGSDVGVLVTDDLVLREAWLTLAERDREVLMLAAWEGLTEAQIAVVLDMSVGGASAALSRARTRLREALSEGAERIEDEPAGQ